MKLEGIRVIDLSVFLPGPYLTLAMADHGVEVIKIEPPGVGDPGRHSGLSDGPSTVFFRNLNRGKKSVLLDLKDPAQRDALLSLCEESDVFVESFRPGAVDRLGAGYEAVRARNPRIVYCSISAFGQTGPWVQKTSLDLGVQALAGTLELSRGLADGKPNMPNLVAADMASSLTALSAILMALLAREKTGKGEYIDIAMYDALLAWTPNITGTVLGEGRAPEPLTMRNYGGQAMNRLYETKDGGFIALAGSEAKFAENLLRALGRLDFLDLAKGEPGPAQKPLIEFFIALFATKTRAEWETFLEPIDLCWAPVRTLKDAFGDANAAARGLLLRDASGNPHIGPAIKFRNEPAAPKFELPNYEPGKSIKWAT